VERRWRAVTALAVRRSGGNVVGGGCFHGATRALLLLHLPGSCCSIFNLCVQAFAALPESWPELEALIIEEDVKIKATTVNQEKVRAVASCLLLWKWAAC
jgi:hypothetical protein